VERMKPPQTLLADQIPSHFQSDFEGVLAMALNVFNSISMSQHGYDRKCRSLSLLMISCSPVSLHQSLWPYAINGTSYGKLLKASANLMVTEMGIGPTLRLLQSFPTAFISDGIEAGVPHSPPNLMELMSK
jgi:hypothetical protein